MQVNTQTIVQIIPFLNLVWSAPLQIIAAIVILWQYLEYASLTVIVVVIISGIVNGIISKYSFFELIKERLKVQDKRVKLTNEILNGIKVIKLFGWEISFTGLVEKIRIDELNILKGKRRGLVWVSTVGQTSSFAVNISFLFN